MIVAARDAGVRASVTLGAYVVADFEGGASASSSASRVAAAASRVVPFSPDPIGVGVPSQVRWLVPPPSSQRLMGLASREPQRDGGADAGVEQSL